jgi:hypothetical protein
MFKTLQSIANRLVAKSALSGGRAKAPTFYLLW